jgi:hypothetical protein
MSNTPEKQFSLAEKIGPIILHLICCPFTIAHYIQRFASLKTYRIVLDWVKKQNLPLDTARELKLPFYLAGITRRGTVYALHTDDDRYCILMKTWISPGRENFYGTFYCDEPLSKRDILPYRTYDCDCIRIQGKYICLDRKGEEDYGPNFQELYVDKRHNDQLFEVQYTLN